MLQSYQGAAKVWAILKHDNRVYITIKVLSVILSVVFAAYTLHLSGQVIQLRDEDKGDPAVFKNVPFRAIYWFLFIYYSFHACDELIELFSIFTKRPKGSLGLIFEINHFLGLGLTIYIFVLVFSTGQPKSEVLTGAKLDSYNAIYNWLFIQTIFTYISFALSIILVIVMAHLNKKHAVKVSG